MIRVLLVAGMVVLAALGVWQLGKAGLLAAKAWAAPVLIEKAFNRFDQNGEPALPWPWADSYPVATLEFPKQRIKRFILSERNMRNLAFAPSLQEIAGHNVIFAHRDTHFAFLRDIELDDVMSFRKAGDASQLWQVNRVQIVRKDELYIPDNLQDELILLVTCYPFEGFDAGGDLRYVAWLSKSAT
ncbi:sortase domain-containing protein [Sneathiella glossodoripedis]|uniref:sortase domain-containing protein n=1 Tax=Sneathiella glossodoripedis TaxID=418853 RepID=UPI0004720C35|nr:sortase [Sneathiella glossodoripedis]